MRAAILAWFGEFCGRSSRRFEGGLVARRLCDPCCAPIWKRCRWPARQASLRTGGSKLPHSPDLPAESMACAFWTAIGRWPDTDGALTLRSVAQGKSAPLQSQIQHQIQMLRAGETASAAPRAQARQRYALWLKVTSGGGLFLGRAGPWVRRSCRRRCWGLCRPFGGGRRTTGRDDGWRGGA